MAQPRTESPARGATERTGPRRGTVAVVTALEAAVRTELLCVRGLFGPHASALSANAFGETPTLLGDDLRAGVAALDACEKVVSEGGRAAAFLSLASLVDARRRVIELVERRRPVVLHAIIAPRGERIAPSAHADLHALGDIGVAVLLARDAQDAADLVLVAHRAAEDAEAPVVVVHDGWPASYARDRVVLPDAPMIRAELEPAPPPLGGPGDEKLAPHRRAASRIPFALASAMRAFERHAGRKVDAIEAVRTEGADVVLVACGAVAESARGTVEHLRANGTDPVVGVVQVVALRPFPGPQIVKAVGRARAVAVIERADAPLAQSNPLAAEVKAAFADALTWAPSYPGIGRIPTIFGACIDPSAAEASSGELLAIVESVIQGEQGRRSFRIAREGEEGVVPPSAERRTHPREALAVRWAGDPSLLLELLVDLYGGHVRATPRHAGEGDELWDVTLSATPVRAHHGAAELDVIVLHGRSTRAEANELEALGALREGGSVLVLGGSDALSTMPATVRAEVRARRARVFAVEPRGTQPRDRVASLCGALLRACPPPGLDRAQIVADVERAIRQAAPSASDADVRALLDPVVAALEATAELPHDAVARA